MRLIDADKLRKEIHMSYSDDLDIREVIDEQPSAYDVDKVIKELNRNSDITNWGKPYGITLEKAIKIVKSGGVVDE